MFHVKGPSVVLAPVKENFACRCGVRESECLGGVFGFESMGDEAFDRYFVSANEINKTFPFILLVEPGSSERDFFKYDLF